MVGVGEGGGRWGGWCWVEGMVGWVYMAVVFVPDIKMQ